MPAPTITMGLFEMSSSDFAIFCSCQFDRQYPQSTSCEIVSNPGLKSERNVGRRLPAFQGEVAGADQMAHYAVADPNREAPQPHACAGCLNALGRRRPETRYISWVTFRQRVSAGRYGGPEVKSSGPRRA